ncbi:MAG: efflux RND transporter permease subunit, partial [Planctomycetes bacterium]|nr:efflux RND transporter permease subunit [Planctomycetota bacterium]
MIRALVEGALRRRVLVVLGAAIVLAVGIRSTQNAPLDAFPEFAQPLVEVQTEAPGLSSLEVERLVTTPLESVLAGVAFAETVRSKSVLGLSSVVLLFERGTDLFTARQLVQERLATAGELLPDLAHAPIMLAPISSTARVLKIGLTSRARTREQLTELVRWTLRPQLLAIPGVADVATWGSREPEIDIRLDPVQLDLHGATADDVIHAIREATAPKSGGFIDGDRQRLSVRPVS